MAFPTSPTNGQQANINGITYTYSNTLPAWTVSTSVSNTFVSINVSGNITGTTGVTFSDTSTQNTAATGFGFKNRIINGAMVIDQRNAGASQTFTAAGALAYSVDRWYGYCTGANVTGQQVAGSGAVQNRYRFTGAASVTAVGFGQRIEQKNSYDLAGSTCTLSADLAISATLTTVTWTAYYATTTADTFGSLASPTVTQIATGTFTVSATVTNFSTNISIPAAATTGIQILFTVGALTAGLTWTIGNVQLEKGSTATAFDYRPYGTELTLCQRYCQVYKGSDTVNPAINAYVRIGYGPATGTGTGIAQVNPLVILRVIPSVTTSGSFALYDGVTIPTISAPTLDTGSTPYSVVLAFSGATGLIAARAYQLLTGSQTAYLWLTAEL